MKRAHIFIAFIGFISLIVLASCATTSELATDDVSNIETIQQGYPDTLFLTAQGRGESAIQSEAHARLNLARIFSVRITGDQQSYKSIVSSGTGDQEQIDVSQSFDSRIQQQTDQIIEGSELITVQDSATRSYITLAILERKPAAQRLRQQIAQLDQQTNDALQAASETTDMLNRMAYHYSSWQAQLLADTRRQHLAIVAKKTVASSNNTHQLRQQVVDDLAQLQCHTTIEQLDEKRQQLVYSSLAKAGIEQTHQDDADCQLQITADIREPFERDNWYWQTASIDFVIREQSTTKERGGWSLNFKVSATEQSLLPARLNRIIAQRIEEETLGELLQLANKTLPQ